jgi:hypothetical protein
MANIFKLFLPEYKMNPVDLKRSPKLLPKYLVNNSVLFSVKSSTNDFGLRQHNLSYIRQVYSNKRIVYYNEGDEMCHARPGELMYKVGWPVMRSYSCGQLKNLSHVTVLPLGPFPDVWPEHITRYSRLHGMLSTAIEQRQILCSFHGRYAPERRMFMKALELLPEEFACTKRYVERFDSKWGANHAKYGYIVSNSKFVLCPRGHNIETHRLWEALEGGAIPIQEYHIQFTESSFLRDAPFPVVRSWRRDLPCLLAKYVEDVEALKELSRRVRNWYLQFVENMRQRIRDVMAGPFIYPVPEVPRRRPLTADASDPASDRGEATPE